MTTSPAPAPGPVFEIAETRHGRMVVLTHDTYISRSLREYGEWTESEFTLMSQVLQPGDNVIDVGANIGALTVPFARAVAPGLVYAFEPQPRIFQVLSTNCVLNHAINARLFNAGCGAEPSELELAEIGYGVDYNYGALKLGQLADAAAAQDASDERQLRRKVPIVRLDDVFHHRALKLMKIDVEGMETEVLKGATRLIAEHRPALYVENEFPDASPALLRTIFDLGYDAYWHVAALFNPSNHRGRRDDIFGGCACVNMMCVPREKAGQIAGFAKVSNVDEHPRRAA